MPQVHAYILFNEYAHMCKCLWARSKNPSADLFKLEFERMRHLLSYLTVLPEKDCQENGEREKKMRRWTWSRNKCACVCRPPNKRWGRYLLCVPLGILDEPLSWHWGMLSGQDGGSYLSGWWRRRKLLIEAAGGWLEAHACIVLGNVDVIIGKGRKEAKIK